MLRRKLLFNLAPVVGVLLLTAVAAIWLLQGVLSDFEQVRTPAQHESIASWFRTLVMALGIVFLVLLNFCVVILLRIGAMIVRPVETLLKATRELGKEHFDFRVRVDQNDEFDELARAYNSLAEQLEANEQKKIETLAQAAVTMNHELNNAISIIDLQLALLSRQASGNPAHEKCLRQIHISIERVTTTVQSLKHIRRIVLTDYVPGTKMLDLQRCVQSEDSTPPAAPHEAQGV